MITVQDVFRKFLPDYLKKHKMSNDQAKAAYNIMRCKTIDMGANTYSCEECGHTEIHYNSCRNRHCPQCQQVNNAVWVDKRRQDVINAPYFHLVCTIPKLLHTIILQNKKLLYNLMYKAVAETISELAADEKYLGAQVGFFCVLHTWGQDLNFHPHIHTVVMAGGLNKLNKWRESSKKFFIPVRIISSKLRGKFLYYLTMYYKKDLIKFMVLLKIIQSLRLLKN